MTMEQRVALLDLREALIDEEYKEVSEALSEFEDSLVGMYNSKTKEHLAKEICDLIYVLVGTAVDLGIDLTEAFKLVHENNMLKVGTSSVRDDGKLVKPKDHPSVDLSKCV